MSQSQTEPQTGNEQFLLLYIFCICLSVQTFYLGKFFFFFYGENKYTEKKRVYFSGNTFWSHICRKTFGETTSLTLISSRYIDYTFSTLFACVLQISAEIESNHIWYISGTFIVQPAQNLFLCLLSVSVF